MPDGIPVGEWLVRNGFSLQDNSDIDSGFLLDPTIQVYDADLLDKYGWYGLAITPNYQSVKGNIQYMADRLGLPQGVRGIVIDSEGIKRRAKQDGVDPQALLMQIARHEMHHLRNDGIPGVPESMAYAFAEGREIEGRGKVPFDLTPDWTAYARTLQDPRDLWEMLPNPTATSSASAEPVGFRPTQRIGFRAPPAPRESRLQPEVDRLSTSRLTPR